MKEILLIFVILLSHSLVAESKLDSSCLFYLKNKNIKKLQNWNRFVENAVNEDLKYIKDYYLKNGLYFATAKPVGENSFEAEMGASASLVKSFKDNGDIIYEINENGKILRSWEIPYEDDKNIYQLKGNSLLLNYKISTMCKKDCNQQQVSSKCHSKTISLKIFNNGNFEIHNSLNKRSKTGKYNCPKNSKAHKDSAYRYCFYIKDNMGKKRLLVSQMPMT